MEFRAKDLTASVTINFRRKATSGGHSDVYRGELALGGDDSSICVAVKLPRYAVAHVTDKTIRDVNNEIDLWSKLEHPNVLPLLGIYLLDEADSLPGAVSPWCDDGTLIDYLKATRNARTKLASGTVQDDSLALLCREVELLSQATSGLQYLHAQNIIHGDLKGCNILVQDGIARLSDFGYSVLVAERLGSTSSHLGTLRWFAPEFMETGARRTREADIWALGCVVLEACTLELPYHGRTDAAVPPALLAGDLPYTYPHKMDTRLWRIAKHCWSRYPSERATLQDISTHLQDLLTPLRTMADIFVFSTGSPFFEFTTVSLLSAVARMCQEAGSDSNLGLSRVQDVIGALEYLGERYPPSVMRSAARVIATRSPVLADQLMAKLSSPELCAALQGDTPIYSVAFLPDGRRLVSSSHKTLRIWDIETGETVIGPLEGHSDTVRYLAVHGSRIASCSWDGTFRVWDADSGKLVLGPITAHQGQAVYCIAYSRDGTRIATARDDNRTAVWDTNTGVRLREMVGHTDWVWRVAFSEDGTRLVSCSSDRTIRIWDVASGKCIGEPLTGHTNGVSAVCFGHDDKHIFSSSGDGTIRIWDAETRALIGEPLRMDDWVVCMALSSDGKRLVSGSQSGKIAMWDTQTGAEIPTPFKAHTGYVWSVAFSPDERMIASASEDKTIALWDATDDWKRWDIDDDDVETDED